MRINDKMLDDLEKEAQEIKQLNLNQQYNFIVEGDGLQTVCEFTKTDTDNPLLHFFLKAPGAILLLIEAIRDRQKIIDMNNTFCFEFGYSAGNIIKAKEEEIDRLKKENQELRVTNENFGSLVRKSKPRLL